VSSFQSILIPRNVMILRLKCLPKCESLSSIIFESNSYLTWIESWGIFVFITQVNLDSEHCWSPW
jgi:hypothetical protein